tara:strand:+ start:12 stop:1412 length:1401 start_codon:yes stop_codon:yes gene_type:complete
MPTSSNRRQRVIEFSTPKVADLVVIEVVDASRNIGSADTVTGVDSEGVSNNYGDPHPNTDKFPKFKLALIKNADDDQGQFQYWYYVKDRDDQDNYNWEFQAAGGSSPLYDTVVRTYVLLRSTYNEYNPAISSNMPTVAVDPFTDAEGVDAGYDTSYVLFEKKQVRSGDDTLDSLYVIEQQVYVKKIPIRRTDVDPEFDTPLKSKETLFHRDKTVVKTTAFGITDTGATDETGATGLTASALFKRNKIPNDFFGTYLETNALEGQTSKKVGILREGRQLTDNWYAIAEREVIKTNTSDGIVKSYTTYQNYTWPAVLLRIEDENWSRRDGGTDTIVYPIYKRGAYSGPTKVKVELYWTDSSTGFPVSSAADGGATHVGTIVPMLPEPCVFQTPIATVNVPPTLHDQITVTASTGTDHPVYSYIGTTWTFLSTNHKDWPDDIIIADSQKPYRGGYLRERITAYKPVAAT